MGMRMSIIPRYFILSFAFPSSLPCILCNRNGDAKMSRQTEVHTLRRQCHIRKALSSRLENVLKSRLYMRYVFSIYSPPIQSFTFSQEVLLLPLLRNIAIVIPRLQSIRHEEGLKEAHSFLLNDAERFK